MADDRQKTLADTIAEGLLGSMDIVVQKALSDLQFDKTYQPCKIIQRAEDEANKYVCEYENKRFEAYSDQSFFADDLVQVLVPQNNWNNQKTIVGRVMMTGAAAYNFKYPFDDFITIAQMDVEDLYSLLAGCSPIAISDIDALGSDLAAWIKNQEHYVATTGGRNYIFGHTPYSVQGIIDEIATNDMATVAGYAKNLLIFTSKQQILNLIANTEKSAYYAVDYINALTDTQYWTAEYLQNIFRKISIKLAADNSDNFRGVDGELNKQNAALGVSQAIALINTACSEKATAWDQDASNNTYPFKLVTYDDNGDEVINTINRPGRIRLLNTLENTREARKTAWLNLITKKVDWTKINRDWTYAEFVDNAVIDKSHWDTYVTAWLEEKADYFRGRTMEEVYNAYRMTAICGGPDNVLKFWANRHFKDRLNENHFNLPRTKLCSFVPANGAKSIQGFTKAGLALDITTLLGSQRIIKGEYGVYIQIEGSKAVDTNTETTEVMTKAEYEIKWVELETKMQNEINAIEADTSLTALQKQEKKNEIEERYAPQFKQLEKIVVLSDEEDSATGTTNTVRFDDSFNSTSDFYGNVYAYTVPYTQQKLLNISNFVSITRISLYAYQSFDKTENRRKVINQLNAELADARAEETKWDSQMNYFESRSMTTDPQYAVATQNKATWHAKVEELKTEYDKALRVEPEYGWMKEGQDPTVYYKRVKDGYTYEEGYTLADPDDINVDFEYELPENIYFENPYLGLGFSRDELKDGKLILYTMDDLNYGALGTSTDANLDTRNLKLVWVYPDDTGVINIYPTWKPGYDIDGNWQESVELQPYEYNLFYRREQSQTFEDLKNLYIQRYDKPYDSARAKKQKEIYNKLSEWIVIIRNALDNAKAFYLTQVANEQMTLEAWEMRKSELIAQDQTLKHAAETLASIADMSLMNDDTAKAGRILDFYESQYQSLIESIRQNNDTETATEIITKVIDLKNQIKGLPESTLDANTAQQMNYLRDQALNGVDGLSSSDKDKIYQAIYRTEIANLKYKEALAGGGTSGTEADIDKIAGKLMDELTAGAARKIASDCIEVHDAYQNRVVDSISFTEG